MTDWNAVAQGQINYSVSTLDPLWEQAARVAGFPGIEPNVDAMRFGKSGLPTDFIQPLIGQQIFGSSDGTAAARAYVGKAKHWIANAKETLANNPDPEYADGLGREFDKQNVRVQSLGGATGLDAPSPAAAAVSDFARKPLEFPKGPDVAPVLFVVVAAIVLLFMLRP